MHKHEETKRSKGRLGQLRVDTSMLHQSRRIVGDLHGNAHVTKSTCPNKFHELGKWIPFNVGIQANHPSKFNRRMTGYLLSYFPTIGWRAWDSLGATRTKTYQRNLPGKCQNGFKTANEGCSWAGRPVKADSGSIASEPATSQPPKPSEFAVKCWVSLVLLRCLRHPPHPIVTTNRDETWGGWYKRQQGSRGGERQVCDPMLSAREKGALTALANRGA